jgi:hypothetical protein
VARKSRKRRRRRRAQPHGKRADASPAAASGASAAKPTRPGPARRRPGPDDPPRAPWGSFPLVELVVLISIVMLIAGFVVSGTQGAVMIGTALVLGSLAGLELAVREHFAGYRSHTLLLSAAAAIAVLGILFFGAPSGFPPVARIAAAAAVFGVAAWWLTGVFRRRSGGLAFRLGGFRSR